MESVNIINLNKKPIDVTIDNVPYKVSESFTGTYKELGEKAFTTKFTLIRTIDEEKNTSYEVILQDEFDVDTTDMINKSILDQVEELF